MKNIISRVVGGFVIGVIIGEIVQLLISLPLGQGEYMPVVEQFRSLFVSKMSAVTVQILLTGLIGVTFATSSLVFDIVKWSLLKQYIVHFCITALVWGPIVTLLWMPKTSIGTLIFFIGFLGTYVITWTIQYMISKNDIKKINAAIQSRQFEGRSDE
ncbi:MULTISPECIES: DUF3021 domain-containing protein [Bacillus]|uniref:DUF3021 domain-containing protein n=1 Tax=Bacillus TaxID=1386 RepID=UPI0001A15206|nr:DUF3021 domain-containing protein [Bacillus pseudomycoides]EEM16648.1 hypothetical protein bpmyx0001_24500 [Bacillus pseudomycoides DSM 12442]MED1598024.1 DUF3021 domain-containing protein [Bacillus pseudomycoides]MED4714378.1 DUF3021 domain-containing protein [Bacillus pseudomycoides]OOR48333.1 hypothetical protein BLX05_30085 [Bacillus pseudomycoides]PDY10599.1 DUF3021 domain-containing protein [Bacillus pseudomycoides]